MFAPRALIVYVNWLVINAALLCCSLVAFKLSFQQIRTLTCRRISIQIYLLFSFIMQISFIITDIAGIMLNTDSSNQIAKLTFYISYIITSILTPIQVISFGLYLKLKLEKTFNHSFFDINKSFNNVLFVIYSVAIIISYGFFTVYYYVSYWNHSLSASEYKTTA
eukprot:425988_1